MSENLWRGDAKNVAAVQTYAFGGTFETTDIIKITINNKAAQTTAGSVTTTAVVTALVTFFNNLDESVYPEFAGITASASSTDFILTADDVGVPFTCTIATTETNGAAADNQTISPVGVVTTANTGQWNWEEDKNWSTAVAAQKAVEDVYIDVSTGDILYGLNEYDSIDNPAVTLTSLNFAKKYTGNVGLPVLNEDGYYEYRPTYLRVNATVANIGYGDGQGSRRLKLDFGDTDPITVNVFATGTPIENGVPALLLKGSNASHVLNIRKGSVGVAHFPGELAAFPVIRIGSEDNLATDANVFLGAGCTNTTITQNGGNLIVNSSVTTLTMREGVALIKAGSITTLNIYKGRVSYTSSGSITTANVFSGGVLDFSSDPRARAVTTINMYAKSTVLDPNKTMSGTPAINLVDCDIHEVTLRLGRNITITRS